jgi:hypothetical protein
MIMAPYTYTLASEAAQAPLLLFTESAALSRGDRRETGLILTTEQIKQLKRYELAALALPTKTKDVIAYLGHQPTISPAQAKDYQHTFKDIRQHASLWNPLRTDILKAGDRLLAFAGAIQVYGSGMNEIFDDIKALNLVERYDVQTPQDLQRVQQALKCQLPGIDKCDRADIAHYLDEIQKKISEREAEATRIKHRLDTFGEQLAGRVIPAVKLKLASIDNNVLDSEIRELQTTIDARAQEIEEQNKTYKQLVKQAIGGITTGLILTLYLSVEAANVRKERNVLRQRQSADIALMHQTHRGLASLNRLRMSFQDLDLIVIDTDIATKNLITVWNKMSTFIIESRAEVNDLHDGLSLRRFKNTLNRVLKPWQTIEKDASTLLDVFTQADAEFKKEYGN